MDRLRELMGQAGLPTPERIAAALALAEADCKLADAVDAANHDDGRVSHEVIEERARALAAYRATAPKPRFNPARISQETRERAFRLILDGVQGDSVEWADMRTRILDESREPPDPQPYGPSSVDSAVPPPAPAAGATFSGPHPIPVTKESSDTPAGVEVGAAYDACSCEESEALKARIEAILSHVIIVNGTSYRVRDLLAVQPLVKVALR